MMKPRVIAHRGFSAKYPENTMTAFRKAVEAGAEAIELDVHLTKDKKVIVHHFFNLGTTDNGEGRIFEKDSEYIRSLDAGGWFNPKFKGEKIPFLEEVINEFRDTIFYEIELKSISGKEHADAVLEVVKKYNILSKVEFTSFQYPLLSYIKRKIPSAITGFIDRPKPDWMDVETSRKSAISNLLLNEVDFLHCRLEIYDRQLVKDIHNMGVKAHIGICDTEEEIRRALELGVDQFCSNNVQLALKIVNNN